jgi:hypothetical protein
MSETLGGLPRALAFAEVINDQLEVVREFSVPVDGEASVQLDPGTYLVRAILPSGAVVAGQADVVEAHSRVMLTGLESAHEWLGWQTFTAGIASAVDYAERYKPSRRRAKLWHRLWARRPDGWRLLPWPRSWVNSDGMVWKYRFDGSPDALQLLQVGGVNAAWRLIALPPTQTVEVMIRPFASDSLFERGVQVEVESNDYMTEAVLRYLTHGAVHSARIVGEEALRQAEQMLHGKIDNPFAAAVGGYHLLRIGALERLHDWPNNFANLCEWLPDAAIIHAWQLLRGAQTERHGLARLRLLEATQRGVPLLTEGLRLLSEGLKRIDRQGRQQDPEQDELRKALARVAGYTNAADWTQPFTTFYGLDPEVPTIASRTGVPVEWNELVFLAEGGAQPFSGELEPARSTWTGDLVARTSYRVAPSETNWAVTIKGDPSLEPQVYETKADAVKAGRHDARTHAPSRLVIHRRDRSTEAVRAYDP